MARASAFISLVRNQSRGSSEAEPLSSATLVSLSVSGRYQVHTDGPRAAGARREQGSPGAGAQPPGSSWWVATT